MHDIVWLDVLARWSAHIADGKRSVCLVKAIGEKTRRRSGACPSLFIPAASPKPSGVYTRDFPNQSRAKPLLLDPWWIKFRRRCALPDVRVHDLRHSFASSAIMDGSYRAPGW